MRPFEIIAGIAMAPRLRGTSYHYTTRTGIPIHYPSAYSRCGWSSMVYHNSTRRVEVGEDWLNYATTNFRLIRLFAYMWWVILLPIKRPRLFRRRRARYIARVKFAYHKVYTYTHAWRKVARSSWGPVSVLASCETIADTKLALKRGYASALVVDHHNGPNAYMLDGMRVIPCPQQTKGITCDKCRLCTDDQYLKSVSGVIAFAAHGVRTKMVKEKLIQLS
ncbi:unnamed protein product [Sphagnum tenellum]